MSVVHWHDFDRGHWRQTALRWGAGALFIVAAHAAVVYGALILHPEKPAEASPAAVMIELAPLPVSLPSQEEDVAPGPQMVASPDEVKDAPDTPDDAVPPPEPVERQAEKTPEPVPDLKPEPAPVAVAEKVVEPEPSPVPSDVVLPLPKPEILKETETPKPAPERVVQEQKKRKVERRKEIEREAKASRRERAPTTSAAPRAEAAPAQRSAAPSPGAGASRQSRASWAAQVSAHLNRFKRYPPGARGASGRPSVRFSVSGSGQVTGVSLSRSSGNAALDAEAVATVRRASPFPRPPDGQGASFSVPVNFVSR